MIIAPTFFLLRVLIKRYADFSAMADYDVGDQWKLFVLFIPSSICAIVLPILSSFKSSEKQKFWKVLHANLLINGLITVVVALVVILCSGYITSFYGKEFNNPIPLIILSISCVFAAMASVTGSSIASLGRMWTSCLINFQWTILLLGIAYFLMRMGLGTTGASLAVLISYMEILMVQYSYLRITHHKSNK